MDSRLLYLNNAINVNNYLLPTSEQTLPDFEIDNDSLNLMDFTGADDLSNLLIGNSFYEFDEEIESYKKIDSTQVKLEDCISGKVISSEKGPDGKRHFWGSATALNRIRDSGVFTFLDKKGRLKSIDVNESNFREFSIQDLAILNHMILANNAAQSMRQHLDDLERQKKINAENNLMSSKVYYHSEIPQEELPIKHTKIHADIRNETPAPDSWQEQDKIEQILTNIRYVEDIIDEIKAESKKEKKLALKDDEAMFTEISHEEVTEEVTTTLHNEQKTVTKYNEVVTEENFKHRRVSVFRDGRIGHGS